MAEIVLDCPHCASERVGFNYGGQYALPLKTYALYQIWQTLWVCRKCVNGVVVTFQRSTKSEGKPDSPEHCSGDPEANGFELLGVHPKREPVGAPEHVPSEIAQNYKEAANNLRRGSNASAGIMCRRVLDRATMRLASDELNFNGMNLLKRIDTLAERQAITPAMKKWAHHIRLDGNEAAHEDEDFDRQSARQIMDFTELFLIYAFTLPGRVELADARRESGD